MQGHCLAKHPSKPIRCVKCCDVAEESCVEPSVGGGLAEVKIESVESLAFGSDLFDMPQSGHVTTTDTHWTDSASAAGETNTFNTNLLSLLSFFHAVLSVL